MTEKKGSDKVRLAFILGGCGCLGVTVIGILAAIAIPSFIGYTRSAKASEARANVESLYVAVQGYYDYERPGPDGALARALPPSLPRTPAAPGCGEKQTWPMDAAPGWAELGFTIPDPFYYAYEYERDPDGRSFTIRAIGDLDCDGVTSRFEIRGVIDAQGQLQRSPGIFVENEHE